MESGQNLLTWSCRLIWLTSVNPVEVEKLLFIRDLWLKLAVYVMYGLFMGW